MPEDYYDGPLSYLGGRPSVMDDLAALAERNKVPGLRKYLESSALSEQQPVYASPASPASYSATPADYPAMPADYAQRAEENARRAYAQAAQASFGARGELSKYLDDIDTSTAFNYSPEAAKYLYDVGRYPTENTEYDLSPINLMKVDPQTKAPLPYTSSQLEQYAQQPLADQFYANFNQSKEGGWDVGTLQFAPDQQYRLIDRNTGKVVYSGTGYEAGKNISNLATGLFDKSGQKADWLIQEAAPGSNEWTQRYEHVPDVNGFNVWLKMVAPMLGGALAAPLGLAGNLGAAAGSAIGSAGAGIASGDSIGDILKSAAISGLSSYAAGELFNKLGAGPKGGSSSGGGGSGGGGGTGGGVPATGGLDEIVVTGLRGASPAVLGSLVNSFIPTVTTNPITGEMTLNRASQVPPEVPSVAPTGGLDEIVVTAARGAAPAFGTIAGGLANAFVPTVTTNPITGDLEVKRPEPTQQQEQTDALDPNEIVVTGAGTKPGVVPGFGVTPANAPSTAPTTGPEPRRPDYGDKVEEQPQDQPDDEIVVTGTGTAPGAVSGLGAAIANAAATSAEQPAQDQTQQNADDEIVVTGTGTTPGAVSGLAGAIADAAATSKDAADAGKKDGLDVKKVIAALTLLDKITSGGGGGSGTGTGGKFQPIFSAKLPTPGQGGALMVGGLKGPTKGAAGTYSARPVTDWYRFGMGPAMDIAAGTDLSRATSPYAGYGPGTLGAETFRAVSGIPEQPTGMAHGGSMGYARGSSRESFAVNGPGTGRSDDIPAVLSDGEYVIDAETVALLGDGSSKAGAKKLDEMRVNIRKHKGRNLAKGKFSVNAKAPERYLSGGRA